MERVASPGGEIQLAGNNGQVKKDGWFLRLTKSSFRNYWNQANVGRLGKKHAGKDAAFIAKKLTSRTARRAALLGAIFSIAISTDVLLSLVSLPILPANVTLAIGAAIIEAVLLTRMRIDLICNLAKVYDVQLDPENPLDILTVLTFAVGKSASLSGTSLAKKVGSDLTKNTIEGYVGGRTLNLLRSFARKMGLRVIEKSIVKYIIPIAAVLISMIWNYRSIKATSKAATLHFSSGAAQALHGEIQPTEVA